MLGDLVSQGMFGQRENEKKMKENEEKQKILQREEIWKVLQLEMYQKSKKMSKSTFYLQAKVK